MNNNDALHAYIARSVADGDYVSLGMEDTKEVNGITVFVECFECVAPDDHRTFARICLQKHGLCYQCEGVERSHWDFFPVTVDGKPYILFSKTLYGFTLLDSATLTEAYDFFPEKVCRGEESFIITHAQSFGKYLIFDGCYWGAPYEFAAYDPVQKRFVSLSEEYGVFAGDYTAEAQGNALVLKGLNMEYEPAETTVTESDIDRLMVEQGTTDF